MRSELSADDASLDSETPAVGVATLEPAGVEAAAAEWTGPCCEKCDAPIKSDVVTICRQCGWYASLGTFVEIDQNWETVTDDTVRNPEPAPEKSHLRVWIELVPQWGWVILASALIVVVESIVARLVTPADGTLRTTWSLTQLTLGIIAAIACHIFNFVVLATEDADFGVMDILLKPLKLWIRAVDRLPTRLWVANMAVCGVVAAAMSMLVIGALPYERLWDWGFEQPVKQELMGAVMDRAKQIDSRTDDLEEAIGDFAGKEGMDEDGGSFKMTPEKHREKADCIILGYSVDRAGRLDTVVLGAVHRGKLTFAGRVSPEMSEEARSSLLVELMAIKTLQPFIVAEANATWVKPKFTCRVTYGEKLRNGQLREVKWDALLGSIKPMR